MAGVLSAPFRNPAGGLIDRAQTVGFTFDGRAFQGHPGDSLASALLADGVRLMGRSFKYHRPRGVLGAGVEEPNALVGVGEGGRFEPNSRATDLYLYDGLTAISQNRWPSLAFDVGAASQWIAPFIPAGFYYKTFFGGPKLWAFYEHFIRRAAGLGRPPGEPDPDPFDHRSAFCDVLVVGAGPAGLAAAEAAAQAGARVMLVEQDVRLGGALMRDPGCVRGESGLDWAARIADRIVALGGRVLTRSTAMGFHDHGMVSVVERRVEAGQVPIGAAQRLWHVRARRVVLAQGAIERPMLFSNNDRPGVMLATAARTYAARYGVRAGSRAVVAGVDDRVQVTARALAEAGIEIAAIVDSREGAVLVAALGAKFVTGARISHGRTFDVGCDLIAMSGGQTPVVHLHMQAGGGLDWREPLGAFVPTTPRQNQDSAGAGAGVLDLDAAVADGERAGASAAALLSFGGGRAAAPRSVTHSAAPLPNAPQSLPPSLANPKTAFIDFQNDVTAADVDLAWREGYRSVEHLKRYTTLGMASDQGKTSNLVGLDRMARALGKTSPELGLTTFRPPYTPVTLGALAGGSVGAHAAPHRRLPLQSTHAALGAVWQPSGFWSRPRLYGAVGETDIALAEAQAVRRTVGMVDVSTLAKFEVAGPDAAAFLALICATSVGRLKVGRGRYTVMLREDGIVADDGTVWRLAARRFLMTSSTGGAETMAHHLSYVRRVLAPNLRVSVTAVQERWAAIAVAGPLARAVLTEAMGGMPPPDHMACGRAMIGDQEVMALGASYSGERAFEIYGPSFGVAAVWSALLARVRAHGGRPYGLDAMDLLRIEKGHLVVGAEIDGRMSPLDLGLGKSLRPGGFIGWAALQRPDFQRADRLGLVGLEGLGGDLPEGAMLVGKVGEAPQGHVTSAGRRVLGEGAIGLGLVRGGPQRLGDELIVISPTRNLQGRVRLTAPVFYDAAGTRYGE